MRDEHGPWALAIGGLLVLAAALMFQAWSCVHCVGPAGQHDVRCAGAFAGSR